MWPNVATLNLTLLLMHVLMHLVNCMCTIHIRYNISTINCFLQKLYVTIHKAAMLQMLRWNKSYRGGCVFQLTAVVAGSTGQLG